MTDDQIKCLNVMPIGQPMRAVEILRSGGGMNSAAIGQMCLKLAKMGFVKVTGKPGSDKTKTYTKLKDVPAKAPPQVRVMRFNGSGHGGNINRVSLPVEPWRVEA